MDKGRSTQFLHTVLELAQIHQTIVECTERQTQLIEILNALAFSNTHPEAVRLVMASREHVGLTAISNGTNDSGGSNGNP